MSSPSRRSSSGSPSETANQSASSSRPGHLIGGGAPMCWRGEIRGSPRRTPWLVAGALVAGGGAVLAWAHFEAGWVRLRTLQVALPGLPDELTGLRIVHLSDFHLGFPSRASRAIERAVRWTAARDPDLVLVS